MKRFAKWLLVVLVGAFLLYGGSLAWQAWSGKGKVSQAQAYASVAVRRGPIVQGVKSTGSVTSSMLQNILIKAGGNLSDLTIKEGDVLKVGQVMARLDSRDVSLNLEKSRFNVQKLQNQLNTYLKDTGELVVKAPASGIIQNLTATEGQNVQDGALLAKVVDMGHLEVTVFFNSSQISSIAVGQTVDVFLLDFYSNVPGKVERLNNAAAAGSAGGVLYSVTVSLKNPGALKVGMKANVTVKTPQGDQRSVNDGQLQAPDPKEIRAGVAGKVEKLAIREGDAVQNGQQLLVLVNDSLEQNIEAQRLSLKQAQLDVASAEQTLADMTITSPINGTVINLPVKLGDELKMGAQLATVADYSKMQVVVPIDELDIAKVTPGMEAEVTADALPGKTFEGTVEKIAEQGKVQSGVATFDVTLAITRPEGLKVGMTINANIILGRKEDALLLPVEAVQTQSGRSFVLVKRDDQATGTTGGSSGKNWSKTGGASSGKQAGQKAGSAGGNQTGQDAVEGNQSGQAGNPAASKSGSSRSSSKTGGGASSASKSTGKVAVTDGMQQVQIQTGLVSDIYMEILSGLSEGQEVLIVGTSSSSSSQMRMPGMGGGLLGGGGVRVQTGGGGQSKSK